MGYGFRNDINPKGMTSEQIEVYADWVTGHYRSKRVNSWGRGDSGVYRPRRLKSCYCGGHSTGKTPRSGHAEFMRYSVRLIRRAEAAG